MALAYCRLVALISPFPENAKSKRRWLLVICGNDCLAHVSDEVGVPNHSDFSSGGSDGSIFSGQVEAKATYINTWLSKVQGFPLGAFHYSTRTVVISTEGIFPVYLFL